VEPTCGSGARRRGSAATPPTRSPATA
jgi:hypothetical protein